MRWLDESAPSLVLLAGAPLAWGAMRVQERRREKARTRGATQGWEGRP